MNGGARDSNLTVAQPQAAHQSKKQKAKKRAYFSALTLNRHRQLSCEETMIYMYIATQSSRKFTLRRNSGTLM